LASVHGRVTMSNFINSKRPIFIGAASFDRQMKEKQVAEIENIISKKRPDHVIIKYPNTYHGFAIRGDDRNEHLSKMKIKCMHDVGEFFNREFENKK